MSDRIVPLIMCGGAGTRLWPLSREDRPKQFINLFGRRSTFQETVLRVADPERFDRPVVVTGAAHRALVRSQLEEIGCEADILLESARRDSGPAIVAGTLFAARRDPHCVVLALAADHIVQDVTAFISACAASMKASIAGNIVTFGVKPERPATEYGYISPGAPIDGSVRSVISFVEKPDLATATHYVQGGYLWNSGNFMFRADILLEEYRKVDSESVDAVTRAVNRAEHDRDVVSVNGDEFERATPISIDYAVMEKTTRAAVIPVAFGWSDVGTWSAVWDLSAKDAQGNATRGDVVIDNAHNCYASSDKTLVALEGVNDLVVVVTGDAVLVSRQHDSGGLKKLVAQLKNTAPHVMKADCSNSADRSFDIGDGGQVRRVLLGAGDYLLSNGSNGRAKHWIVLRGDALVTIAGRQQVLGPHESIYAPAGTDCRVENPGGKTLELIEVQL